MNTLKTLFKYLVLFSFTISCKSVSINTALSDLQGCVTGIENLTLHSTITNARASIQMYESELAGNKTTNFLIKYLDVPTGFLSPCELPDEFKKDGISIEFSGRAYVPKNINNANMNSIPLKLTQIKVVNEK